MRKQSSEQSVALLALVAVALFTAATSAAPPAARFKYPAFAMIRGGGLPATVILGKGIGGIREDITRDSLGLLFDFSTKLETVDTVGKRAAYEVAGFYGTQWSNPDNSMRAGVRWEEATTHMRILVLAKGNLVWDAYGAYRYYAITPAAVAYLRRHGVQPGIAGKPTPPG